MTINYMPASHNPESVGIIRSATCTWNKVCGSHPDDYIRVPELDNVEINREK